MSILHFLAVVFCPTFILSGYKTNSGVNNSLSLVYIDQIRLQASNYSTMLAQLLHMITSDALVRLWRNNKKSYKESFLLQIRCFDTSMIFMNKSSNQIKVWPSSTPSCFVYFYFPSIVQAKQDWAKQNITMPSSKPGLLELILFCLTARLYRV